MIVWLIIGTVVIFFIWMSVGGSGSRPIMKPSDIDPIDEPVSTVDARRLYRSFMKLRAGWDAEDIRDGIENLNREMKEHLEYVRDEVDQHKEDIAFFKANLKKSEKDIRNVQSDFDQLEDLEIEQEDIREDLESSQSELETARKELQNFKKDKRDFLVDHINSSLHGHNWREIAERKHPAG